MRLLARRSPASSTTQFERDLERSEEIDLERWSDRPLRAKVNERVLTLARREL